MILPSAIIFVNNNLNDTMRIKLEQQLRIHNTLTGAEFDSIISTEPTYVNEVELNDLRILVIRDDYFDRTNRDLADVVVYLSHGLASVELNKVGAPTIQMRLDDLNIFALLRAGLSPKVVILKPTSPSQNCGCSSGCQCNMFNEGIYDPSGVNCINPDNHYNNPDWINRS